jgi:hypothetical protein
VLLTKHPGTQNRPYEKELCDPKSVSSRGLRTQGYVLPGPGQMTNLTDFFFFFTFLLSDPDSSHEIQVDAQGQEWMGL